MMKIKSAAILIVTGLSLQIGSALACGGCNTNCQELWITNYANVAKITTNIPITSTCSDHCINNTSYIAVPSGEKGEIDICPGSGGSAVDGNIEITANNKDSAGQPVTVNCKFNFSVSVNSETSKFDRKVKLVGDSSTHAGSSASYCSAHNENICIFSGGDCYGGNDLETKNALQGNGSGKNTGHGSGKKND